MPNYTPEMKRPALALLPAVIAATLALSTFRVAAAPHAAPTPLPATAFAYDQNRPLDLRVASSTPPGASTVQDVSFVNAAGTGRIHANLVLPERPDGSAVLFVHWLGDDPKATNLEEFKPDALALAEKGTTSLLIDAPWSDPNWFEKVRSPATDYAASIAQVKDLRRSLDVLLATRGVDPHKLAYVGHDFGAMYGAVLSGVDPRPAYYVLAAGTTTFSSWFLLGAKPADPAAYVASMQPLDPLPYLARSQARGFLLQFALHDEYIPAAKAQAFAAAAPEPKRIAYYDTNHALAIPAARADRIAWLNAAFGR